MSRQSIRPRFRLFRSRTLDVSALCVALLAAGCGSAPPGPDPDASAQHVVVELVDDAFVRVNGVRQPWEEMVYAMRLRCREHLQAGAERTSLPSVEFRIAANAAPGAVSSSAVDRIQAELRRAGVRHITMVGGGGA